MVVYRLPQDYTESIFMERFYSQEPNQQPVETPKQEQLHLHDDPENKTEAIEYVPGFQHIQEDLLYLFTINVTSETSLNYPWVKDEMYAKVVEELKLGTPFALDYMFEEKLLTKEELLAHGLLELKPYALQILATYKGTRLARAKQLFIDSGLLTKDEVKS